MFVTLPDDNELYLDSPIHYWFGLTYANFLTLPRVILEAMPYHWQMLMVKLLEELNDTFDWMPEGCQLTVSFKEGQQFAKLPERLFGYRRPDYSWLDSIKKHGDTKFKCMHRFVVKTREPIEGMNYRFHYYECQQCGMEKGVSGIGEDLAAFLSFYPCGVIPSRKHEGRDMLVLSNEGFQVRSCAFESDGFIGFDAKEDIAWCFLPDESEVKLGLECSILGQRKKYLEAEGQK